MQPVSASLRSAFLLTLFRCFVSFEGADILPLDLFPWHLQYPRKALFLPISSILMLFRGEQEYGSLSGVKPYDYGGFPSSPTPLAYTHQQWQRSDLSTSQYKPMNIPRNECKEAMHALYIPTTSIGSTSSEENYLFTPPSTPSHLLSGSSLQIDLHSSAPTPSSTTPYHPGLTKPRANFASISAPTLKPAMPLHVGRPSQSYAALIQQAIESSPHQHLSVSEIYTWFLTHYPYFRTAQCTWKNSIRHNLTMKRMFVRESRPACENGKGGVWRINYAAKNGSGEKQPKADRTRRQYNYHPYLASAPSPSSPSSSPSPASGSSSISPSVSSPSTSSSQPYFIPSTLGANSSTTHQELYPPCSVPYNAYQLGYERSTLHG
ncbi:uncharacterized protein VTP21DRAFT_10020 [Calcarisporiella thermophila]|uniref:uncharacterized protein n=1 Tax=Calcarisporiella thermophila TaxID=911321 RepID=UPI00374421E2